MSLDRIDKEILNFLQDDAKITTKALSNHLQLSLTAIHERIKKMERNGVIKKYVALVNPKKAERDFKVLCHVKLILHKKQNIQKFEREIAKLDEVLECMHVSGDYDYILKVQVKDMLSYREFVLHKLTTIEPVGSTQSTFIIDDVKHSTRLKF